MAVVAPVPPLATTRVDDNPAAVPEVFWLRVGNVQFVKVPLDGVPRAGVVKVGLVLSTIEPVPVTEFESVTPP